jgi:phosphoserine phosphatase
MYTLNVLIPKTTEFTPELEEQLLATLAPNKHKWTQPGRVMELIFNSAPAAVQMNVARKMGKFDLVIQRSDQRKKKLLICDMDSTIIGQECIDELADYVGKKAEVAAITERAMQGELDFKAALKERVALLKGLPMATLQQCFDERIRLNEGADKLVKGLKERGVQTILVSGGFAFFAARVAQLAGFEGYFANILLAENDILTGEVREPILDKDAKKMILEQKMKQLNITPEEVIAIGDGANDIPMLQTAKFGVAYRAKQVVQDAVKVHLNHADLDALLHVVK